MLFEANLHQFIQPNIVLIELGLDGLPQGAFDEANHRPSCLIIPLYSIQIGAREIQKVLVDEFLHSTENTQNHSRERQLLWILVSSVARRL